MGQVSGQSAKGSPCHRGRWPGPGLVDTAHACALWALWAGPRRDHLRGRPRAWPAWDPCGSSGLLPSGSARKGNHTGCFSDAFMARKSTGRCRGDTATRGEGARERDCRGERARGEAHSAAPGGCCFLLPEESAQHTPVAQQHEPTRKGAGSGPAPLPEALRLRSSGPAPKPEPLGACREGAAPAGSLCPGGAAGQRPEPEGERGSSRCRPAARAVRCRSGGETTAAPADTGHWSRPRLPA